MIVRREIEDRFLKYSIYCQIVALFFSTIRCFIVTSYNSESFVDLNEQDVSYQQIYFELPFYMFLVVIASFLFNWEHAYQLYQLVCREDQITEAMGQATLGDDRY